MESTEDTSTGESGTRETRGRSAAGRLREAGWDGEARGLREPRRKGEPRRLRKARRAGETGGIAKLALEVGSAGGNFLTDTGESSTRKSGTRKSGGLSATLRRDARWSRESPRDGESRWLREAGWEGEPRRKRGSSRRRRAGGRDREGAAGSRTVKLTLWLEWKLWLEWNSTRGAAGRREPANCTASGSRAGGLRVERKVRKSGGAADQPGQSDRELHVQGERKERIKELVWE